MDARIYVACLASYNAGTLHGEWIDVTGLDADEINAEIQEKVLLTSPNPNVWIECPDCDGEDRRDSTQGLPCGRCSASGKVFSAEEYAIHDHEGFPCAIGEYESIERIAELVAFIDGTENWPEDAALALIKEEGADDLDRIREILEDGFRGGPYSTEGDYAAEFYEDMGEVPEHLAMYIDYQSMERDMEMGGDIRKVDVDGGFYVFDGSM